MAGGSAHYLGAVQRAGGRAFPRAASMSLGPVSPQCPAILQARGLFSLLLYFSYITNLFFALENGNKF